MPLSDTATEVAKGLASNPSCLAAVALAALMAGLTYVALSEDKAQAHELTLKLLAACEAHEKQ